MDFRTTRHYTSTELVDLNIAQNLASKIYNYIGDTKSNGASPANCATELSEIINMIHELHSKVSTLVLICDSAGAMESHLKEFKS